MLWRTSMMVAFRRLLSVWVSSTVSARIRDSPDEIIVASWRVIRAMSSSPTFENISIESSIDLLLSLTSSASRPRPFSSSYTPSGESDSTSPLILTPRASTARNA